MITPTSTSSNTAHNIHNNVRSVTLPHVDCYARLRASPRVFSELGYRPTRCRYARQAVSLPQKGWVGLPAYWHTSIQSRTTIWGAFLVSMFYVLYFPYFECLTKEFDIQLFKNAGALARPHENTTHRQTNNLKTYCHSRPPPILWASRSMKITILAYSQWQI